MAAFAGCSAGMFRTALLAHGRNAGLPRAMLMSEALDPSRGHRRLRTRTSHTSGVV
jgi:hypothetical protein